jgi:hypothetical protein
MVSARPLRLSEPRDHPDIGASRVAKDRRRMEDARLAGERILQDIFRIAIAVQRLVKQVECPAGKRKHRAAPCFELACGGVECAVAAEDEQQVDARFLQRGGGRQLVVGKDDRANERRACIPAYFG